MIMVTRPTGKPFQVARVGKVQISVGQSWPYLLIGLLIILLSGKDLTWPSINHGAKTALLWCACLVAAVLIHETGHFLMSLVLRVPAHPIVVDVWAGHVRTRIPRGPGREMLVAGAGPIANLITALGSYYNRDVSAFSLTVVPFLVVNLGMFIYHMLPGLPQDGGFVVSGIVSWVTQSETSGMEVGAWAGRFVAIAAALSLLCGPMLVGGQPPSPVDVLWVSLVLIMMWRSTSDVFRVVHRRHVTDEILTRSIARPTNTVAGHTRLDIIDATYTRGSGVIVLDDEEPVGVLVVGAGGPNRREVLTAGDVMLKAPGPGWVLDAALDGSISDTADALAANAYPVMAVRTDKGLYGLVWRSELNEELRKWGSGFDTRRTRSIPDMGRWRARSTERLPL